MLGSIVIIFRVRVHIKLLSPRSTNLDIGDLDLKILMERCIGGPTLALVREELCNGLMAFGLNQTEGPSLHIYKLRSMRKQNK